MTRYVLNIILPQINYQEADSELDILYSKEIMVKFELKNFGLNLRWFFLKLEHFPILKELESNYSEEPFGELSTKSKILLLQTLCESLLFTKKFEEYKISLEDNLEKIKAKAKQNEASLAHAMKIDEAEFIKNRAKFLKEATSLK